MAKLSATVRPVRTLSFTQRFDESSVDVDLTDGVATLEITIPGKTSKGNAVVRLPTEQDSKYAAADFIDELYRQVENPRTLTAAEMVRRTFAWEDVVEESTEIDNDLESDTYGQILTVKTVTGRLATFRTDPRSGSRTVKVPEADVPATFAALRAKISRAQGVYDGYLASLEEGA